ncbi:MAG TPA: hypothetical protein VIP98_12935 [Microlunatus sp.]
MWLPPATAQVQFRSAALAVVAVAAEAANARTEAATTARHFAIQVSCDLVSGCRGNALLLPALIGLLLCQDKYAALPLVAVVGVTTDIPFAVLVKLGQDYLPTRPGTAAGVTLGLAVSAGGLAMPLLGLVADQHGPRGALTVLAVVPVIAIGLSTLLREPDRVRRSG